MRRAIAWNSIRPNPAKDGGPGDPAKGRQLLWPTGLLQEGLNVHSWNVYFYDIDVKDSCLRFRRVAWRVALDTP